jgi:cytochrome oxidase Cu insertion factor (SCO1/SenC/PrrC family)
MSEVVASGRSRTSLVALFSIGFIPVIIAWVVFFYFPEMIPNGTTNEGNLVTPPVQASDLGLIDETGKWTLIIPVGANCDADCEERFYLARQVNVALGKESERVHRVLVDLGADVDTINSLMAQYPNLARVEVSPSIFESQLGEANLIFLMDPIGNIFMVYPKGKAGKPMMKDIKHLLKYSNIG